MFKELTIGAHNIAFLSNGLTPIHYKNVFGDDLLKQLNASGDFELAGDKVPQLAFIMAKQGEKADMSKQNIATYYAWLEGFEPLDMVMHGKEIVDIYMSNSIPTAEPKKKAAAKAKEK